MRHQTKTLQAFRHQHLRFLRVFPRFTDLFNISQHFMIPQNSERTNFRAHELTLLLLVSHVSKQVTAVRKTRAPKKGRLKKERCSRKTGEKDTKRKVVALEQGRKDGFAILIPFFSPDVSFSLA